MSAKNILIISTNGEVIEVLLRLVNNYENWIGKGVKSGKQAQQIFKENNFDIVLFGVGIPPKEELDLIQFFNAEKEDIIIIQHYGGGSGLLYNEIQFALEHNGKSSPFLDDAFRKRHVTNT